MNFLSLLAVLFIGLKLAGIILWSWWLVLLPLYLGLVVFAIILIGTLVVGGGAATAAALFGSKPSIKKRNLRF